MCQGSGHLAADHAEAATKGAALRQLRESKGVSLRDLAAQLGSHHPTLLRLELGRSPHANYSRWMQSYQQALANPKAQPTRHDPNPA